MFVASNSRVRAAKLVGDDVCGAQSGVVDEHALSFFKKAAADYITVLGCGQVGSASSMWEY
eukprot:2178565-Amphidinium_carterae.2